MARIAVAARRAVLFGSTCLIPGLPLALSPALAQTVTQGQIDVFANTPEYQNQYGLGLMHAATAYARGYTGQGITIAIGDTGFDTQNQKLVSKIDPRSKNYILEIASDTYDDTQIRPLSFAGHGGLATNTDSHGSHVAGLAAGARDPSATGAESMHGVAFDANFVAIRLLTDAYDAPMAVQAVPDAANVGIGYFASLPANVKIMNASFGPGPDEAARNDPSWDASNYYRGAEVITAVLKADKIIVAANGNDRDKHPVAGTNPSGIGLMPFMTAFNAKYIAPDTGTPVYFGADTDDYSALWSLPGRIVAVMAIDVNKQPGDFSNLCGYTASWCVAAAGVKVNSTVPYDQYKEFNGTSMAAPQVSGALAILQGAFPTYSAIDLTNLIFSTAEDLGAPGVDKVFGYGLVRLERATDGPDQLNANAAVNVAALQTDYWSRPFTTDGAFSKTGSGNLMISGVVAAAGDVTVTDGALGIGGTLMINPGSTLRVDAGGLLAGIGSVVGATSIAGTLSPGHLPNAQDQGALAPIAGTSPGTLTFNGNVTLTTTATTTIAIDGPLQIPGGPGTYSKIFVAGPGNVLTLGGTITAVLRDIPGGDNAFTPRIGDQYQFITTINGASYRGAFLPFAQPTVGLGPNTRLDLVYARNLSAVSFAVTPISFAAMAGTTQGNDGAVAAALDAARPSAGAMPSGPTKSVFDALYETAEDDQQQALETLSGQGQAAGAGAVMASFTGFSGAVSDRQSLVVNGGGNVQSGLTPGFALAYSNDGPSLASSLAGVPFPGAAQSGDLLSRWSIWGQAYGQWSKTGAANGLPGASTSSGGFTLGADRAFWPDLIGGAAFGFIRGTTKSAGTTATADTFSGSLYASWTPGAFVIDARLAAGPSSGTSTRHIELPGVSTTASGSLRGFGGLFATEVGYRLKLNDITLKPFAGLSTQMFRRGGFTETSDFGLTFPAQTFNKLTASAGVMATTQFRVGNGLTLMPMLKLTYARDLRDDALVSQAALLDEPFLIQTASPGRDAVIVNAGLVAWQTDALRVYGSYTGEVRRNAVAHQVMAGIRKTW